MAELRPKRSIYNAEQILSGWENQVPKIGTNGNWWVWDIPTKSWKDTGVGAEGRVTGGVADVRIGGTSVVNTSGVANVDAVRYDTAQSLTDSAKEVARTNIGAGNPLGTVAGGLNQWNEKWVNGYLDYGVLMKGNPNNIASVDFIDVRGKTSIYVKKPNGATTVNVSCYDSNFNFVQGTGNRYGIGGGSRVFNIPSGVSYLRFYTDVATYNNDISINYPSTATAYEPYYPSNLQLGRKQNIVNLFNPTFATTTQNGITCTNNGDGTLTINGTATAQAVFDICTITLNKGTYQYDDFAQSSNSTFFMNVAPSIEINAPSNTNLVNKPYVWTITNTTTYSFKLYVRAGQTVNHVTFKPMLSTDIGFNDFIEYGHYTQFGELLWTNASTSAFSNQKISVDLSKYNSVGVIFKITASGSTYTEMKVYRKDQTGIRVYTSAGVIACREIEKFENNGVTFGTSYYWSTYNGTTTSDNARVVPYQIYGIR